MMYLYHRKPIFEEEEKMFLGPELVALGKTQPNSWLDNKVESIIHQLPKAQVNIRTLEE
jgi:hypothetical protein